MYNVNVLHTYLMENVFPNEQSLDGKVVFLVGSIPLCALYVFYKLLPINSINNYVIEIYKLLCLFNDGFALQ